MVLIKGLKPVEPSQALRQIPTLNFFLSLKKF